MRNFLRTRKQFVRERTSHVQRIQKTLEDANIKLDSVITDIMGLSGRRMIEALIAGETDPFACCRPDRRDLDGKAKVLDAADEAKDLLAFRTAVEVVAAEVLVQSAVLQPASARPGRSCLGSTHVPSDRPTKWRH
jgi:hypothetical protein